MSEEKKKNLKKEQKPKKKIKAFSSLNIDKAEYQEIVLSQSNNNNKGFGRGY